MTFAKVPYLDQKSKVTLKAKKAHKDGAYMYFGFRSMKQLRVLLHAMEHEATESIASCYGNRDKLWLCGCKRKRFLIECCKPKNKSNHSSQSQQKQITQWTNQNLHKYM